jgi:hypothetical protein
VDVNPDQRELKLKVAMNSKTQGKAATGVKPDKDLKVLSGEAHVRLVEPVK